MSNSVSNNDDNKRMWPEEESRRQGIITKFCDRIFYSYMNQILKHGSQLSRQRKILQKEIKTASNDKDENDRNNSDDHTSTNNSSQQELSHNDLFEAPQSMHSDYLIKEFNSAFIEIKEEMMKNPKYNSKGFHQKALRRVFMKTLWRIAKPTYIPAGFYQLITVLVQTLTPLVVKGLLVIFENHPYASILSSNGILFAVALFLCSIIDGLAQERHKFLAFQTGISIRAATVNSIYNHNLNLSAKGKENLMTGETTNLVAIDCQKLFEVFQEGHLVWSCPLSMIIVTILLLFTLGEATLVGMASMVMMVPLVKLVITKMGAIRRKRASFTDKRVEVTTAMLQAIRFCKLNHYEQKFLERVHEARKKEMRYVRKELSMFGWTMTLTVFTPVIASALTFITYVLIDEDHILTSADTFTTLLLFAALRFPINYVGKLIGKAAQGIEACQRIANFLDRDATVSTDKWYPDEGGRSQDEIFLDVQNGNFTVGKISHALGFQCNEDDSSSKSSSMINEIEESTFTKSSFTVSNINFKVKKSEVFCIVGPVASGKSTLLQGLIGDVAFDTLTKKARISMNGNVAYASQSPFILNSTLRENILFGLEYNKELYDSVLEACNLLPDLKQLGPAQDLTEIGERGVTLSGGQKARISIARVVYSQPSVALFDDVLSALDATTGKWIFEHLFDKSTKRERLLSNAAVVLVTHASHFLSRVDNIMILFKGSPLYIGNWDGLSQESMFKDDKHATEITRSLRSSVQELGNSLHNNGIDIIRKELSLVENPEEVCNDEMNGDNLMTAEEREYGLSDWKTWLTWFRYAGGFIFITVTFITLFIDRAFYVINELWLATWTAAAYEEISRLGITFPAQTEGLSSQRLFILIFATILAISFIATMIRSQFIVQGGASCADKMFYNVTNRVVGAPMIYFETTPIGRILNRLTYDIETTDISLSQSMTVMIISLGWFTTGIVLQISILPLNICVIIPITILYWLLLLYYRKTAVDLQRLDAVSRSPVQARLNESMEGCTTIRVFNRKTYFENIFKETVDINTSAMMNFMASQRWLGARFQVLGSLLVLFACSFVAAFNDWLRLETGIIAMLIIWSSNFTITLGFFSQGVSETEAYLTSIERLQDMTKLPQERNTQTPNSVALDPMWPSSGNLTFENVCLRYRPGLPLALQGLSFNVAAGQRIGICGRTGAGKSTITAALFRLCEIESGRIVLDGQDISYLGLADVRGRKNGLSIIPQDPVLFSGSLRECLDPWCEFDDNEILEALQTVQVVDAEERGVAALDDFVDEGGRNFSVGERQLISLARAILTKPKVLVLDEATASVDSKTDSFIQKMIRKRFIGTTMLTIAHRLNTIMDYDMVLVMEKGKVAEFDTPWNLLQNEDGLFTALVDSTGHESSLALRKIAEKP